MGYLGLWVKNDGVNPQVKIRINKNMTQIRQFIGLVNYYHDVWKGCLHTLETLTTIAYCKVKFKWTKIKPEAFKKIKRVAAPGFYQIRRFILKN